MSDTVIFGKTFKGYKISTILYVINSLAICAGGAMMAMKPDEWGSMSLMQQIGWWLLILGNATNTLKAAVSSSTKPPTVI
jgi:hypothetical protein